MLNLQIEGAQQDEGDGTCQSPHEPLQINEACEDFDDGSQTLPKEFVKVQTKHAIIIVFFSFYFYQSNSKSGTQTDAFHTSPS